MGEALPEAEGLWDVVADVFHIWPREAQGTASDNGLSWAEPEGPVGDISSDPLELLASLLGPREPPKALLPHISLDGHRELPNDEPIGCVALSAEGAALPKF